MSTRTDDNRTRRGSVLVAVLWLAGILGVFAAVATMSLHAGARASRTFADSMRADEAMRGALEQALVGGQLPHLGTAIVPMGQTMVYLKFEDEMARVDINDAPIELIAGVFRAVGVARDQANVYAARVIDWRDADDKVTQGGGAEVAAYRAAGRVDGPRNGPFQHVDELALVLGISPRVAGAVAPYITVASGSDMINPIIAPPPVLMALPGVTEEQVGKLVDERKTKVMTLDYATLLLGDVKDYVTADNSKAVRVDGLVRLPGNFNRRFEVVLTSIQGDTEPYRILAWETDPPAAVREVPAGG